jgi:hypothetical protein
MAGDNSQIARPDAAADIEELRKKVDALAVPLEDALAHRVFVRAQEQLQKWMLMWVAVATAALLAFGITGWRQLVEDGRAQAATLIQRGALAKLQKDIEADLNTAKEQIRTSLIASSLEDASRVDRDLARIVDEAQANIDNRLSTFGTQVAAAVNNPRLAQAVATRPATALRGFAYYGTRSDSGWAERNFRRIEAPDTDPPGQGDRIEALVPVNARSGVISYDPQRGWVNAPTVGLIRKGQQVRVLRTVPVAGAGSFIWVEFERQ